MTEVDSMRIMAINECVRVLKIQNNFLEAFSIDRTIYFDTEDCLINASIFSNFGGCIDQIIKYNKKLKNITKIKKLDINEITKDLALKKHNERHKGTNRYFNEKDPNIQPTEDEINHEYLLRRAEVLAHFIANEIGTIGEILECVIP